MYCIYFNLRIKSRIFNGASSSWCFGKELGGFNVTRKNVLFSGFMLFSLFFGAGNLIFPPLLGLESGSNFGPAIIGFLITGVLLPFMAIMAIALAENGLISIGSRVHRGFGLLFAILVYISIGAFVGIASDSNVGCEFGFRQLFSPDYWFVLFVFFFLLLLMTFSF